MDRKYLEEHLSAYLDNELEPKKLREFEQALKAHPDLQEQIERLQKLNQLARESEVPMPADGYFDGLSERIEARIEREYPRERGKIVDFLLARRKTVAIISSVAAVLLITVISVEFYGPEREMYPGQIQRMIELKQEEPKKSEPAQTPQTEEKDEAPRMMVKPPQVYGDTALGEVKAKEVSGAAEPAKAATAKDEAMLKSSRQGVQQPAATALDATESANLSAKLPAAKTVTDTAGRAIESAPAESTKQLVVESKSDKVETVTETKDLLSPQSIVEMKDKPAVQEKKLEKKAVTIEPQAVSGETPMDASMPPLAPPREMDRKNSRFVWPLNTSEYFEKMLTSAIERGRWDVIEIWPGVGPGDRAEKREASLAERMTAQYASKDTVTTEQWFAERAFLTALEDDFSEQSCVYARVLITNFLKSSQVRDRDVWEARLDSVRIAESRYR